MDDFIETSADELIFELRENWKENNEMPNYV